MPYATPSSVQQMQEEEPAFRAHGLEGTLVEADWPALTLDEVDRLLKRYPQAGGAIRLLSHSPRPFSAASLVATPKGKVFVKRHPRAVRDRAGLMEEHQFTKHLSHRSSDALSVQPVLANADGETAIEIGFEGRDWTYEVHPVAPGIDVYEQELSWTPFKCVAHAYKAGRALAQLHRMAEGYDAPARKPQQLVSSFTIFSGNSENPNSSPISRMQSYLETRPLLKTYAEERNWRRSFKNLFLPLYEELKPWLKSFKPLWTHNDWHASNLMWSGAAKEARVSSAIDFGLCDRTNAIHDLATAIERNCVEWLRLDASDNEDLTHFDQVDALLDGYENLTPLTYEERRGLAAILPLVHCEFALSETDYFLTVLHSEEKARLAYEGYFIAHAEWFQDQAGQLLLDHLKRWADNKTYGRVR